MDFDFLSYLDARFYWYRSFQKEHQDANKVVKVGILQFVTHDALDQIEKGIEDGLKEAGYKGDKVKITLLNAEGDQSKIQTMSKQLVNDKNDVVIGIATPAAQGLAAATKDIPVIMGAISDPVGAKLVKNLKHPEGNVTGTSNQVPIKQTVELVKSLTPNAKRLVFSTLQARTIPNHRLKALRSTLKKMV